jgi:predicted nucleotidyltransferase
MAACSRILLRLPKTLHDAVKARAEAAQVSINTLLERYIAQGIAEQVDNAAATIVIEQARREFGEHCKGLLLFGSRARGDSHDTSDTDLLLVLADEVRIERSLYRRWDEILPEGVSLHIAHLPVSAADAGSLWLECALDARILSDPSGEIAAFLSKTKDYITSGHVVRRVVHGQGFWVPV